MRKVKELVPLFAIPIDVLMDRKLNTTDMIIYGYLNLFKNDENICDFTNDQIGIFVDKNFITVNNSLNKLEKSNFIERISDRKNRKILLKEIDSKKALKSFRALFEEYLDLSNPNYKNFVIACHKSLSRITKPQLTENTKKLSDLYKFINNYKHDVSFNSNKYIGNILSLISKSLKRDSTSLQLFINLRNDKNIEKRKIKKKKKRRKFINKILLRKNKEIISLYKKYSDEALDIIRVWNNLGCGRIHKLESPLIERTLELLDEKILNNNDVNEIIEAMKIFKELSKYPKRNVMPENKITVERFFKSEVHLTTKLRRKGSKPLTLFDRIKVYGKDLPKENIHGDVKPLAHKIKRFYLKHVLGEDDVKFNRKQELDFMYSANMLMDYKKKKRLEKFLKGANEDDYVMILFKALSSKWGLDFTTGHLRSSFTFNDTIPKFLSENYG